MQLLVAVLTLTSTLLTGLVTFFSNSGSTTNRFAVRVAFFILLLATMLAVVKFFQDAAKATTV